MSRSYRKTPVIGITTAESEHCDKRMAQRQARRQVHQTLATDPFCDVLPHIKEVSNVWSMAKDGKRRFDPQHHPKLLRK